MPKKLFSWTNSSKKSDKLVKDAVALEENNSSDSLERTQPSGLSISRLSPDVTLSRQLGDENLSVVRTNDLLAEPSTTPNGALSVTNTQQNVFNLSHMSNVHFGTNIQINNNVEQSSDRRSNSVEKKTTSIDEMMKSNERVNDRVMDVISTHLGENWRNLFRSLGFSDGQIDQMKEDYYVNGVKEVIYRLLLDYSRNNKDASLGHITKIMWKLGFKECVKILKIHWKSGALRTNAASNVSNDASCSKGKSVD